MLQRMSELFFVASLAFGLFFAAAPDRAPAAEQYVVQYRLTTWKTMHFNETPKAEAHLATVKKLGCEAKAETHGGHIDISYVCPVWRSLAVATDAGAHRWEKWLRASGFETMHAH